MNLPSVSGDHQGPKRRPASPVPPLPSNATSAQNKKLDPFLNRLAVAPPSSEKLQSWRFAKPTHAGCMTSRIEIDAGYPLTGVSVESGQSLKTRRSRCAELGAGVANAAPASASMNSAVHAMRE